MADTSFLPDTVKAVTRLYTYTDRLLAHVGEQAGGAAETETEHLIADLTDQIGEARDYTDEEGSLVSFLTATLGSTNMITEGIDDLVDMIVETTKIVYQWDERYADRDN